VRGGHQQTGHRRYAGVTGFGHQWLRRTFLVERGTKCSSSSLNACLIVRTAFVREVSRAYGRGLRI
jgi:hypothetical protein